MRLRFLDLLKMIYVPSTSVHVLGKEGFALDTELFPYTVQLAREFEEGALQSEKLALFPLPTSALPLVAPSSTLS